MSNNNNTLTEVSALVLAALLIIGGVVLLYVGKIDYSNSVFFFISALGIFGFNSAWKAPSPAQTSQLVAQLGNQQELLTQMVGQQVQAPQPSYMEAPTAVQPTPRFTTPVPQPAQQFVQQPLGATPFNAGAAQPFAYEASSTYPLQTV
jgi:hypothetical protein